jgi:hypothetical protein
MKKNILGGIAILVVIATTIANVSLNLQNQNNEMSSVKLANIEALTEEYGTPGCVTDCISGGCGATSCEIEYVTNNGVPSRVAIDASYGEYACCYSDGWPYSYSYKAKCFRNACCL